MSVESKYLELKIRAFSQLETYVIGEAASSGSKNRRIRRSPRLLNKHRH